MLTNILNFFRKDPTRDWPAGSSKQLIYDVRKASLNDVEFDAPLDSLRVFGRPHNRSWRSRFECAYPPLGIEIGVYTNHSVQGFSCYFQPGASTTEIERAQDFAPCRLSLRLASGDILGITPESSADELRRVLRLTRVVIQGAVIWSVVLGKTWLGFSFDAADRLETLDIEAAPPDERTVLFH